jgi:CBS domain-containing protein
MRIRDVMSRDVKLASPNDTVKEAAEMMAEIDAGSLPVGENDRIVGMVTDRDIALRAVAKGKAPDECRVRDIMSPEIKYVFEDESVDDLVRNMGDLQLRRLPVLNRDKRLVGIVSLGDLALAKKAKAGEALKEVAKSA